MKLTTILLSLGATCGLIALVPAQVHAQTLPVTAGLKLWLNADVGITTNASGQVTAWADQSGLGNHAAQATAANCPTLTPNSLNGHATLRVTGQQFLEVPSAGGIEALTDDVTLLTVAKYDNLSGYRGVVSKCVAGSPRPFDFWNNASQSAGRTSFWLRRTEDNSDQRYWSTLAPPAGVFNVLSFRWKAGLVDQFLNDFNNGSEMKTVPVTSVDGGTPLRIGRRADGTAQLLGSVAEILIYQPALSDADLYNVITNYLRPKYGLTFDLPASVSITSPANGSSASSGAILPVTVSASDADGYPASVSVYGNGQLLGTATIPNTNNSSATFQLDVRVIGQGALSLTAVATDNYGRASTSAPVALTITSSYAAAPVAGGLKVWLAADAGITTNASGAVTTWADQSGTANNATQLDEAAAPQWIAGVINGKPVLRFAGDTTAGQFLEVPDASTAFLTDDFSTFAVARFTGSYAQWQHLWSKCSGGVAGPVDWWFSNGGGLPTGYRGDGMNYAGTGSGLRAPLLGQATAIGMTVTAADGVMAHQLGFAANGASVASTNTANAGPLRIGRRADNVTQLNGDIAELLIYDRALSAEDRTNVVGYLSAKYSLVQFAYASPAPIIQFIGLTNGATFAAPATVTFTVAAVSSNGAIRQVALSANGTTFATPTAPPYEITLDLLSPGAVTFTAVATDNWGAQTSSSVVATVTGAATATPAVTNGLQLWLAADFGVTTNSAGAVTAWVDQSLNGRDAAPTAETTSPLCVPNALNGKPVLRFAGGNPGQFLEVAADTSFTAGDLTTFALAKFNNFSGTPAFRTIWTKTAGNNLPAPTDWYFASSSGAANVIRGAGAAGTYGSSVGGNIPAGAFKIVGFKATGTAISHYRDFDVTGSGNITQTPTDLGYPLRIGRRTDGGVQMNGDVAEILIYNRPVSEAERLQIGNYLFNKWGIPYIKLHNQSPTVTLVSPTGSTPAAAPGILSVVAQVTDTDSTVTRVDFLANGSVVASFTAPPYQVPLQLLSPGALTIQAQAVDFYGAIGTSAPVALTITGSAPATPPSAGQVLWLKADAGVTTNQDGTVATWTDQSGKANHASQDLSLGYGSPMLVAIGGKPALQYDYDALQGTGQLRYLVVENSASLSLTNDWSLFYGANFDDFTAIRSVCGKTTINQAHPFDYYVNTAGRPQVVRGDERGSTTLGSSGALAAGSYVVAGVTVEGSRATHYLAGLPNGAGDFSYGAIDDGTRLVIGSRDALDIYFKGLLGEILLYNRALTGSDLQWVNSYLAGRYGIAAVQVSTQPPTLSVAPTSPAALQVSWLPGYAGFVLESRPDVAGGAWTPVATNPPNNQVTIGATNTSRFFRLRAQ